MQLYIEREGEREREREREREKVREILLFCRSPASQRHALEDLQSEKIGGMRGIWACLATEFVLPRHDLPEGDLMLILLGCLARKPWGKKTNFMKLG